MAPLNPSNTLSSSGYWGLSSCGRFCNMWCWRVFKWLPVLLIITIVTWSYYAYVIQLCFFTVDVIVQKVIYLVVYHFLLIMFAWSYWRTIFADIKPVPDKYKLPEAEMEKLLRAESEDAQRQILETYANDLPLSTRFLLRVKQCFRRCSKRKTKTEIIENHANTILVLTRTMSGSVRYCNRCGLIKPDRAHHCSICNQCVLKMDHHCPWVNNCVCFYNYKFFMLFLGYALIYCIFIMATCLPYFIMFWKLYQEYKHAHCHDQKDKGDFSKQCADIFNSSEFGGGGAGRYHVVFAFFVSLMFGISLGSLFGYHCFLVAKNRTTLEAFRAPMFRGGTDKNGFSLGAYNNFKEVFGNSPKLWILPIYTSLGDGCEYPVRREHQLQTFTTPQEAHGYESMGTTRSSSGDGTVYPFPRREEDTESLLSAERWERWGERARPFDERESSSYDEL